MIKAESVVTTDIIKKLKDPFSEVQPRSIERRFERFFNNEKFHVYDLYSSIISSVVHNYKLKNKNVYIAFDHMYCKDSFTVLLFSLRIGKQRYPSLVSLF